ncbi:MAG: T9SS type A sorting domain-containing protein [Bacteroidota bacterium]
MKVYILSVCLMLLASIASAQRFQNTLRDKPGELVFIKELPTGELVTIYKEWSYDKSSHHIAKLDSRGTVILDKILKLSDSTVKIDDFYEYQNGYVLAYGVGSSIGNAMKHYLAQEFVFFDANLVLQSKKRYVINDTTELNHNVSHTMNESHIWSGGIHYKQQPLDSFFYLRIIQFAPDGTVLMMKDQRVDSLIAHGNFVRVFKEDSGYRMFAGYNHQLHSYKYSASLDLLKHDSTSGYPLNIHGAPVFNALGNQGFDDMVTINNGFIATNAIDDSSGNIMLSVMKLNGHTPIATTIVPLPPDQDMFYFSDYMDKRISAKNNRIYVAANYYDNDNSSYVHLLDSQLNNVNTWQIFGKPQFGAINEIKASADGGCFVIGRYRLPAGSSDDLYAYIAKLDSTGILSFVTPVFSVNNQVNLFPNPGTDFISGIPEQSTLLLTDISGRQKTFDSPTTTVDVSTLHSGIYFYQIVSKQGEVISTGKWVKQ